MPDASRLAEGTELVVFEECLDANGNVIAEHKDIDDAGQTVVVDNPDTPAKPEEPKRSMPKTGDPFGWVVPACLAAAAASLAGIILLARRPDDGFGDGGDSHGQGGE